METVSNAVNAASKMIWGEPAAAADTTKQTTEPVSGERGEGTLNDPYDKGNTDASVTSDTTTTPNIASTAPSSGTTASTEPSATASKEPFSTSTNKEPFSSTHTKSEDTSSEMPGENINPTSPLTSTTAPSTGDPASNVQPSTNDPATAAHSTITDVGQKQQGADRPTEAPNAAQTEAVKEKSNVGQSLQSESDIKVTDENREELAAEGKLPTIPNDHSGEPLKMHNDTVKESSADDADPRTEGKKDRSASVSHEGGGQHGKAEGTGELWVKSTGLAAEGGDFDATKPGAGKEANRLLEEKGIKKDDRGVMATEDGASPDLGGGSDDTPKKESKMAKLKEKLHIRSKKSESDA